MFKAKATRDERIASLSGHIFNVVAGETYEFPDEVQTEAILAGCIPVEDKTPVKEELSADDRDAAVYNAVMEILAKGDARLLSVEGFPKISTVKKMIGFEPTIDEIVAATKQLKTED